jgi:hypothetical protein
MTSVSYCGTSNSLTIMYVYVYRSYMAKNLFALCATCMCYACTFVPTQARACVCACTRVCVSVGLLLVYWISVQVCI